MSKNGMVHDLYFTTMMPMRETRLPDFTKLFPGRDITKEWDSRPRKYDLFPLVELPHISYDVDKLRNFYLSYQQKHPSYYETGIAEKLKGVGKDYSKAYYSGIICHPIQLAVEMQKKTDNFRGINWVEHHKQTSRRAVIRSLRFLDHNYNPLADERVYTDLDPGAINTYIEDLRSKFKARPTRIRFGKLKPNQSGHMHIDVIPQYGCRIHFPVWTNPDAKFFFIVRGKKQEYHMEVGKVYLLNGGYPHQGVNMGTEDRIHLIFSMDGCEDYYVINT